METGVVKFSERVSIMSEHLKNVESEHQNTAALLEAKGKGRLAALHLYLYLSALIAVYFVFVIAEVASELHMKQIADREAGMCFG